MHWESQRFLYSIKTIVGSKLSWFGVASGNTVNGDKKFGHPSMLLLLHKLYNWWKRLPPLKFIFVTILLSIFLTGPLAYILELSGVTEEEIGYPDIKKLGLLRLIVLVVIAGPVIETFLAQALPVYFTRSFIKRNTSIVAVSLSTILFSLLHSGYSYWYALLMVPSGLLFALTFIVFQRRKPSAFWMTSIVHSSTNLVVVLLSLIDSYH